jgi:hypothetical protein
MCSSTCLVGVAKPEKVRKEVIANGIETEAVVQSKTIEYFDDHGRKTTQPSMGGDGRCRLDIIFDAERVGKGGVRKRVRVRKENLDVSFGTYDACIQGGIVKVKYMPNCPTHFEVHLNAAAAREQEIRSFNGNVVWSSCGGFTLVGGIMLISLDLFSDNLSTSIGVLIFLRSAVFTLLIIAYSLLLWKIWEKICDDNNSSGAVYLDAEGPIPQPGIPDQQAAAVGAPSQQGMVVNKFDPETDQPIPKFDPTTGKQNW